MSLILVILILLFWAYKTSDDKMRAERSRRAFEEEERINAEERGRWLNAVTDRGMEIDIEDRVYNKDPVLLDEYRKTIEAEPDAQPLDTCLENTVRVLMANRGKLRIIDTSKGIRVEQRGATQKQWDINRDKQLRFVKWIASKVAKPGMPSELYFEIMMTFTPIDSGRCLYGSVRWRQSLNPCEIRKIRY